MADPIELKHGDACPQCGGPFILDRSQSADALIERNSRNAAQPAAAAEYAKRVREKVAAEGELHRCTVCGYQARFAEAAASDARRDERGAGDERRGQHRAAD